MVGDLVPPPLPLLSSLMNIKREGGLRLPNKYTDCYCYIWTLVSELLLTIYRQRYGTKFCRQCYWTKHSKQGYWTKCC